MEECPERDRGTAVWGCVCVYFVVMLLLCVVMSDVCCVITSSMTSISVVKFGLDLYFWMTEDRRVLPAHSMNT